MYFKPYAVPLGQHEAFLCVEIYWVFVPWWNDSETIEKPNFPEKYNVIFRLLGCTSMYKLLKKVLKTELKFFKTLSVKGFTADYQNWLIITIYRLKSLDKQMDK